MASLNWFKYASPATFYPVAGRMIPWFAWPAAVLAAIGYDDVFSIEHEDPMLPALEGVLEKLEDGLKVAKERFAKAEVPGVPSE